MKLEIISYSIKNILERKTRSLLTVISILIGMMAVFALLSFGLGMQNYLDTLKSESGGDKLFLQASSGGGPGIDENFFFTKEEVDFISKINGIKEYSEMYFKVAQVEFKNKIIYTFVTGFDPDKVEFIDETFSVEIVKGRDLKKGDTQKAVLGYNFQFENKVFDRPLGIGDKILLNGNTYEVIGFYSEVGNPNDDASIYVTLEAFEELYPQTKDKFSWVMIRSEPDVHPSDLAERIKEKLRKHKGQDEGEEDFFVQTFEDALESFGNVIGVMNGILLLIGLISIIVAAVNIMNTMYTAVLERTQEIGVMKAIGARNSDILAVFLVESGILGLIGGAMGVFLGYLVASLGGIAAAAAGYASLKPYFSVGWIIFCVLFAFIIGALSGLLPAWQASKLRPVEALRYE